MKNRSREPKLIRRGPAAATLARNRFFLQAKPLATEISLVRVALCELDLAFVPAYVVPHIPTQAPISLDTGAWECRDLKNRFWESRIESFLRRN